MVHLPPDAPAPRLCLVEKSRPDQEYGYNLHAERGRGQFVGTVDRGSAADRAGLRTGDRIFAVNGADIQQETHKKVVERIKENPLRCELLVLAESEAQWYAQRNIPVNTSLPNIIRVPNEGGARSRTASKTNGGSSPPSNWYSPSQKEGKQPVFVAPPPPVDDPAMSDSKPRPRLCYLEKQSPDDEFGFNLHAEKGKGHFIGTVDRGGIGHKAGLEMGQRIVGVHETLVFPNTPHKEVVALIKRFPLTTTLLVASEEVDKWYTEHSAAYSFDYVQVANQPHVYTIDDENATVTPSPREEEHPKEADEHSLHSAKTEEEHGEVLHEESHEDHEEELHRAQNFIVHHEVEEEHIPEHHEEEVHHEEHHDDALLDQVFAAFTPSTTIAHAPPPAPVEEPHEEPERAPSRGSSAPSASRSSLSSPSPQPPSNHREPAVRAVNGSAPKEDIFALSAQEARERLKLGRRSNRAPDMPIEEKYRLVSNM